MRSGSGHRRRGGGGDADGWPEFPPRSMKREANVRLSGLSHFYVLALFFGLMLIGPTRADAGWQLVWSDEFNGSAVNTNYWSSAIGNGGPRLPGWGNNELQYYTSRSQNLFVSNGMLHIVAQRESYKGFEYTSARLSTAGHFAKKFGRFEFRARLPQGRGYWPALWLMPESSTYGRWAASGEIDIMENTGNNPGEVLGTLHFGGPWPGNRQSHGPPFIFPAGDSVTNFHVYALEWTNSAISWYVDNQLYEKQAAWSSTAAPYPAPFDQPFYLIMNLAVGGKFPGNPDNTTVFPGEMQVEYVRVYDWANTASERAELSPAATNVSLSPPRGAGGE
jgi:beta-glucanase (GH16 family)